MVVRGLIETAVRVGRIDGDHLADLCHQIGDLGVVAGGVRAEALPFGGDPRAGGRRGRSAVRERVGVGQ